VQHVCRNQIVAVGQDIRLYGYGLPHHPFDSEPAGIDFWTNVLYHDPCLSLRFEHPDYRSNYKSKPLNGKLCHNQTLKLAIIGHGNVGRALARLLRDKRKEFPFTVTGIHTLRHGTAVDPAGLPAQVIESATFGPRAAGVVEFLDAARAQVLVELSTLNPSTGEPATSHIRAAIARGMHVVTANKGPIAHAYASLRDEAARAGVGLRFESSVMDGAPVFNLWRYTMPGAKVLGFTGVLNSTSKVVIETMERGGSFDAGLAQARKMGITEADGAYDVEGWDSAAKTAALANVLMDARTTPQLVATRGITRLTPERVMEIAREGKTVRLVSRGGANRERHLTACARRGAGSERRLGLHARNQ
jgi:homoserine dehydrogenase